MAVTPTSVADFIELVRKSGILREEQLSALAAESLPAEPQQLARRLQERGWLTEFQARQLLCGRYKGFRFGPYVVQDLLGRGGMGAVYLAEHVELHRKVAIKVLVPAQGDDQRVALERFLREARAAAALDHPNIVRLFDVGRHNNVPYLVMEYVPGETLQQVLEREGAIPYLQAVEYIAQAAAGLQHAHERGFVHRDIKPGNLIRDGNGVIKILDMGLARSATSSDNLTERLDKGAVVGTADFIAPEQALNQANIDGRADIYSLGATLFALIVGKPPFEGSTTQKLLQHQLRSAPRLSSLNKAVPKELCDVVAKMLAKRPEDRFATAAEVIAALAPWTANSPRVLAGLSHTKLGQEVDVTVSLGAAAGGSSVRLGEISTAQTGLNTPRLTFTSQITKIRPATGRGDGQPGKQWRIGRWAAGLAGVAVVGLIGAAVWSMRGGTPPSVLSETQGPPADQTHPPSGPPPAPSLPPRTFARTVYELKMGELPEFTVRLKAASVVDGKRPSLPRGIAIYALKPDTEATFSRGRIDDRDALTIHRHSATTGAQLALELERDAAANGLEVRLAPAGKYALCVDYRGSGSVGVSVHTIRGYRSAGYRILPASGNEWKTAELPFTREQEPLRCAIEVLGPAESVLSIAAVRIVELEPPPSPPALPNGPSASPPSSQRLLFRMDLNGREPFRQVVGLQPDPDKPNVKHRHVIHSEGNPLPNWRAQPWNLETQMEWTLRHDGQQTYQQIRNLKGRGSAMLFMPSFDCPTGRCRLQFEYAAEGADKCFVLKFKPADQRPAWNVEHLPPTNGLWRQHTCVVDLQGAQGGFFEFHNSDQNPNAYFRLRSLTVTELPAVTASGEVLFTLDAAKLPDFQSTKRGRELISGQEPPLPNGVYFGGWKAETISEWSLVTQDGRKAVCMINLSEVLSAQIGLELERYMGLQFRPGERVCLQVEYRTTPGTRGHIYFQNYDWEVLTRKDLPPSPDRWNTVELHVTRGDKPIRCLIDASQTGREHVLYIARVTVARARPEAGGTSAATPVPSSPPAAAPPGTPATVRTIYRLDCRTIPPFRVVKEKQQRLSGDPEQLPLGVGCQCWKPESVGEFRCAPVDGQPALGVTNLNDAVSAQYFFELESQMKLPLMPGKEYLVRIEYRTDNECRGQAIVQAVPGYRGVASVSLASTDGQWRTAQIRFRRPSVADNVQLRMVIDNLSVGEGNTLWIRSVTIDELADN